ncbi:hypothetical protein [Amaricoccus tamworthensis]|uniref:hypothetical protein n=1 Tax=Amaricoccus tamworthensis TaxID=57002 RepID=UPI003C7E9C8E
MFIRIRQDFAKRERIRSEARRVIRKYGLLAREQAEISANEDDLSRSERRHREAVARAVGGILVDDERLLQPV